MFWCAAALPVLSASASQWQFLGEGDSLALFPCQATREAACCAASDACSWPPGRIFAAVWSRGVSLRPAFFRSAWSSQTADTLAIAVLTLWFGRLGFQRPKKVAF